MTTMPDLTPKQIDALHLDRKGCVDGSLLATALDAILKALPKPEPIKDGAYLVPNADGDARLHFVKGERAATWLDKNGDLLDGGWAIPDRDRHLYNETTRVLIVPVKPSDELVSDVSGYSGWGTIAASAVIAALDEALS